MCEFAATNTLLSIATRVPDHGKLTPWRLVVLQDDDRNELGDVAAQDLGVTNAEPNAVKNARGQFLLNTVKMQWSKNK